MAIRTITECDGCGRELSAEEKYYNISLSVDIRADAAGPRAYGGVKIVLCEQCEPEGLLPTLEKSVAGISLQPSRKWGITHG